MYQQLVPIYTRQWVRFRFLNPNLHRTSVSIHIGSLLCANQKKVTEASRPRVGSCKRMENLHTVCNCHCTTYMYLCRGISPRNQSLKSKSLLMVYEALRHDSHVYMCAAQLNEQSQLITVRNCGQKRKTPQINAQSRQISMRWQQDDV